MKTEPIKLFTAFTSPHSRSPPHIKKKKKNTTISRNPELLHIFLILQIRYLPGCIIIHSMLMITDYSSDLPVQTTPEYGAILHYDMDAQMAKTSSQSVGPV